MIDEQDYELPEGWERLRLGAAAEPVKDKVDPKQLPDSPYLGLEHVEAQTMRILGSGHGSDVKSTKTRFSKGDVLYGKLRPYLNKVAQPDFDGICSTDFLVFAESPELDRGFLANYLNQLWVADRAHNLSNGVELPRVDWKSLSNLPIAFPKHKVEQRAIVSQLDVVRHLRTSALGHLGTARRALERFRDAVLTAACSGRLTENWRAKSPAPTSASELLAEVARERKKAAASLGSAARSEPATLDAPDLPNLPGTWQWATLDQIVVEGRPIIYGIIKPGPDDPNGVPYVRVVEMKTGEIAPLSQLKRAAPERASKFARATLRGGDILISKDGTIGRVAIVPPELTGGNITQHLVRASIHPYMRRDYVAYAIRSPQAQAWLLREKKGVALQGVNVRDFRRLPLPIPPLDEQAEIVLRVDQLLSLASGLQHRLIAAEGRVERSSQAVLGKAFRGELLPA